MASASERLRALIEYREDDRLCMACQTNYSMLDRLWPTLPLIADCVQRLEETVPKDANVQHPSRRVLDALAEALK